MAADILEVYFYAVPLLLEYFFLVLTASENNWSSLYSCSIYVRINIPGLLLFLPTTAWQVWEHLKDSSSNITSLGQVLNKVINASPKPPLP